MTQFGSTSSAETWEKWERADLEDDESGEDPQGKEKADAAFEEELKTSETLGQLKSNVRANVAEAMDGDSEAKARAATLEENLGTVIDAGDADITIERSLEGSAVAGVNHNLSTDADMSPDMLRAEVIAEDVVEVQIVAAHERNEDVGHAGQLEVEGVVAADGGAVETEALLEGLVEEGTERKFGEREGQPEELYGEGQRTVRAIGYENVAAYARKDGAHAGDRVWIQKQIFEQSALDPDAMTTKLEEAGYAEREVEEIVHGTRGRTDDVMMEMAA